MNGDDFTTNPAKVLQKFEKFVGIPKFFTDDHFDFSGILSSVKKTQYQNLG